MALLLVIDEDKDSCTLIERVFRRQGHVVETFIKSEDACEWLKKNSPDLTIVSAGKHGEKAKELMASLKAAGIKGTGIVLSTSAASLRALRKAFAGDVREVLVKPWDLEKLEEMVGAGLHGQGQ